MAEFKLGRLRFVWQGEWTTGTAYVKDDIVRYGGSSFVCVKAHTAAADFYTNFDTGNWELMTSGLQWKTSPWTSGTYYAEGDVVRNGGKLYVAVNGHQAGADFNADFDASQWQLFVDGIQWKTSPWATATLYKEGDLVRHGGRVYICVDGHTSSAGFKADFTANKWQVFSDGTQWANTWTAGTLYKAGDVVRVGGKTFICVSEHTANAEQRGGFIIDQALLNWQLYTDGNQYKGAWDTTEYYWPGDLVRYGAKTYVAVLGHEASDDFYTDVDANRWSLFNEGQQWLSNWAAETLYKEGDIVKHGGRVYICIDGHTSDANEQGGFDTDLAANKWEVFSDGIIWKDIWTTGTYYKLNDIVRYGAKAYICVSGHVAAADFYADVDTSKWELLVDGQQWKTSPWQVAATYAEGDLVRYGARVYICINGHTATSFTNRFDIDFDAGNWQLFSDGTQWKSEPWTAGTYYKTGDLVRYGGKVYIATDDHSANITQNGGFYIDEVANKWDLYSDGTEWVGDWTTSTYYRLGDIVRYDGNVYICRIPHTSAATIQAGLELDLNLDSTASKWDTFSEGFKYKGEWATDTKYNVNDVVKFGGSLYICTGYHVSDISSFQEIYWNLLLGGLQFEDTWSAAVEYQLGDIVTYGGYSYVAQARNTGKIPPGFPATWELLTTGFKVTGEWSATRSYKVGELVKYGGSSYVAIVETGPGQKPTNADGSTSVLWEIVAPGIKWRGEWLGGQQYRLGDAVRWVANSYICILDHTSVESGLNQPDNDSEGIYWQSIAEGAEGNVLTRRGDLVTRDAIRNKRLPRGVEGQVLQVQGRDVKWDYFNIVDNVYYVTTEGIDSPERGTTLQTPFRTVKYATEYIQADLANRAPATIYVKTGAFLEELPISVPANVAIVGDELRSTKILPALGYGVDYVTVVDSGAGFVTAPEVTFSAPTTPGGFAAKGVAVLGTGADAGKVVGITITKAGSGYTSAPIISIAATGTQPAAATATLKAKQYKETDMFYLRDATGLRNMTLTGLDVTLGPVNQYYTKRPSTSCSYVSLDPGTGPGDESTWITTRSPYVQNVTTYGVGAVGMKIDGAIHNGGYKTMVCNDYTQVISDGIGIWATNQGRVEAVSVFTYYAHLGYIAEDGGVIRATNGNCSYGTFGVSAEGVDPSEISRISRVNNRKQEASIANTFVDGEGIVHLEYANAGENYQPGNTTFQFEGSGVPNSIVVDQVVVRDGGVNEVRVLDAGKDWLAVVNNAQDGTNTTIRLSASDVQSTNAYKGERIVIIDGQGVGQHGYITHFDGGTKVATVAKESFTPLKVTATSATNNRLTTSSTASLTVGQPIGFDFDIVTVIASATAATTNIITVDNSNKLAVGMPIEFSGSVFGNIVAGTTYYVQEIVNKTSIKISATNNGTEFALASATGAMSAQAGGIFGNVLGAGKTYYVRELIAGGTQFTITETYPAGGPAGTEANLANAVGSMDLYAKGWENFYGRPIENLLDTTTRYSIEPRVVFSTGSGAVATGQISKGVEAISRSSNGGYYQSAPTVIITGTEVDATGATALASITGVVESVRMRSGGAGFTGTPLVKFVGGGLADNSPSHASGTANVTGKITSVAVTSGGTGYTKPPLVTISGTGYNNDAYISAKITKVVGEINILNGGSNYTTVPTITITGGGGTGAEAVANLDAVVTGFSIVEGGSGYTLITTTISIVPDAGDTTGSGATAEVIIDNNVIGGPGVITGVNLLTSGSGYSKPPRVIITSTGLGTGAEVEALISGTVASVTIVKGGANYTSNPVVQFSTGSAVAQSLITGAVNELEIISGGTGFTSPATIGFTPVSDFTYDEAKCSRDVGLIIEAVAADTIFGSNVQTATAGLSYLRSYSSEVLNSQKAETIAAINKTRDLVLLETSDATARSRITSNFNIITSIIQNGAGSAPSLAYPAPANTNADVINASAVLRINRSFLQAEVVAWIQQQIDGGAGIWTSFTYDSAKCARDIGYLVDALAYDLLYGGNSQSILAAKAYRIGATTYINGQVDQTIAAYNYLKSIVDNVIVNDTTWTKVSDAGNQQNVSLTAGTATEATTVQGLIDVINDYVADGTGTAVVDPTWVNGDVSTAVRTTLISAIPEIQVAVINWINGKYVGAGASAVALVDRVVHSITINSAGTGYTSVPTVSITGGNGSGALGTVILNASVTGITVVTPGKNYTTIPTVAFANGNNFKSVVAGLSYYKNASSQIAVSNQQITQTLAAMDYVGVLATAIANNTNPSTAYQNLISRTGTDVAPEIAKLQTNFWISAIKAIAQNGKSNSIAAGLINDNKEFIVEQSVVFADSNNSGGISYTEADLRKRVNLLVDALVYDLTNGTVERTISIGQRYGYLFANESTATQDLLDYFESMIQDIISNTPVIENQTVVNQVFAELLASEITAGQAVTNCVGLVAKMNALNSVLGDTGNNTYTDLLVANKVWIQAEVIEYIKATYPTFDYNQELCARDVGLIVDAIAHDVRYAQSAIPVAAVTTTNVLSNIVVEHNGEGYGAGTTVSFSNLNTGTLPVATPVIEDGAITGFNITVPGSGFTTAPTVTVNAGVGSGAYARAYVLGGVVQQFRIIHPGSGYSAEPYVKLVDPNNTLPGRFKVRIGNGVLDQPTYVSRGTAFLAAAAAVSSPTGYADSYQVGEFVYVQNLTNIPTPGANIQFAGNNQFYKLVTVRDLQGEAGLSGGRALITANRAFVQRQIVAWINATYPALEYDEALALRDTGLIIDAIVADIFGDTERGIEAGKSYYRNASGLAAINQATLLGQATIASIDKIEEYLIKIVQNIDVQRIQLFELQVKEPGITGGAAAIPPLQNTLDIIKDIMVNGDKIYAAQDLLLDNKPYIQAEVMAFISTTYPEFVYNQDLCRRDVGLIVDALAYDLFAGLGANYNPATVPSGLARSREAGLRYYSNASAQIAITTQKAETVAAIDHIAEVAIAVINNINPAIVYQSSVSRLARTIEVLPVFETRIQGGINEIVNIINNGLGVLPAGTYSARLQVSPPFTVDNAPEHNVAVTIRSKYSQVRLTNHDFLNVGTGNRAETNYPGIPVNAPEPNNEVLEAGGGRCFYTSTDQDGNFRVGELFAVEQATGIATLNADAFNLSGLNELTLGGINIGGTGATITEFSTDSLFFANSDSIVPTQKAIKTYIASQLGSGGGNLAVNAITAGDVQVTGNEISTNYPDGLQITVPEGVYVNQVIDSTSTTTGSLVVAGGVGVGGAVNIAGSASVGADLVVEGNLTVNGTTGEFNVGTLSVEDVNLTIASAATSAAQANGAGITVAGPTVPATFTYASADNTWNANKVVKAEGIESTPIGTLSPESAKFTTLAATDSVTLTKNDSSTGTTSGTLVVTGGVGVSENLNVGGTIGTVGLQATGSVTMSPADASVQVNPSGTGGVVISPTGSAGLTINPTTVGTIDNVNIGGTTRGSGKFTTLETNGKLLVTDATAATSTDTGALQVDGGAGINGTLYAGSIEDTPIGATTADTGRFTTLETTDTTASTSKTTGSVKIAGGLGVAGAIWADSINVGGGGIDGTPIGETTRSTGKFTTLAANGAVTFTGGTTSTSSTTGQVVVTGGVGISENLNVGGQITVTGDLVVNGTTTTINATTLDVKDKNIVLGNVASPTNATADGGGITLKSGTGDKNITWVSSTGYWTFNQGVQASSIQNTPIGSSTANTGAFTSLTANGAVTFTQNTASTSTSTGTLVVTGGLGVSGRINATDFTGTIGANTRSAGNFTTLDANNTVGLSPTNASVTISPTGTGTVTLNPATAGTINNMSIGATTAAAGKFTTLSASSAFSLTDTTDSSTTGTGALVVSGGVGIAKSLNVGGAFKAVSKSFLIDHPTREGYKLQYGSLEGPEYGVYVRGKISGGNVIELPDYWTGLVDEATITVNLTAFGSAQALYVEKIEGNKVYVGGGDNFFYTVYGERKDIDSLTVEYKA